jgi:hypothetical protein
MKITRSRPFLHFAMAALSLHTAPPVDPPAPPAGGGTPPVPPVPPVDPPAPPPPAPPAKTPEEIKAEQVAAIKNVLKLPDKSTLDPALTERTAAIASELGLTPEVAQKAFGHLVQEATAHADARLAAVVKAHEPGGTEWLKQQEQWKADALKDPTLGNGKPDQLEAKTTLAKRALATALKSQPERLARIEQSGLFTNPDAIAAMSAFGELMKEDQFVAASNTKGELTEQERLDRMYPSMKKKS